MRRVLSYTLYYFHNKVSSTSLSFPLNVQDRNFVTPTSIPKYYTPAKKVWKFVMMGES